MFSMVTVPSSTRMPTASASPPSVMTLTVSPSQRQQRQREQDGERDLDEDDDRRTPAAEEYQDHQADQRSGEHRLADDAEDGGLDEDRLIADGVQVEARRQALLDPRQQGFDAVDDVERRGRAGLEDRHQHRARAVDADQVGLRRRAVMHIGDVVHVDDRAVDLLDRQIVDFFQQGGTGVQRHVPVELAELLVAGRQDQVLRRDGVDDIVGGNAVGLHRLLIEIDLNLQNLAAVGRGDRGAGDGRKLRPDEVLSEIEQLHLRQLFARQRQLQDRHARGVVAQHIGRGDAGRQKLQHGLRGRRHLRQRRGDIDVLLKEDLDHPVAVQGLRFEVLDVGDLRGHVAFVVVDDAAGHVVRQQPVIGPDHADDRNVDVGKNVDRRAQSRQRSEDRDEEGEHHEGVGPPQGDLNDPHVGYLLPNSPALGNRGGDMPSTPIYRNRASRVTSAADAALRARSRIEPNRRADHYVERDRYCQGVEGVRRPSGG